jgi:hypothetical protein
LVLTLTLLVYLISTNRGLSPSSLYSDDESSSSSHFLLARVTNHNLASSPRSQWSDLTPPLSRESLGQATWSFLHTLAAHYPLQPSAAEKKAALALLGSLSLLYPCGSCREHYGRMVERRPPRVGSRAELTQWMCETHNEVNARLDKEMSAHQLTHTPTSRATSHGHPPRPSRNPLIASSPMSTSVQCGLRCGGADVAL